MAHRLPNNHARPVFYDPTRRRLRRFRLVALTLGLSLLSIFATLAASVFDDPDLPSLSLNSARNARRNETTRVAAPPARSRAAGAGKVPAAAAAAETPPASPASPVRGERIAFYVNWDYNSFTSLKRNIGKIDKLVPEWLSLASGDGAIAMIDSVKQRETLEYIRRHRPGLPIVPLVNNFDSGSLSWDSRRLAEVLAAPESRASLIENLLAFVRGTGSAGVNIDFESVPPSSQPDLLAFMGELHSRFREHGLEVSQSVPPDDPSFDLRALADAADYLVVMAYDEFAASSIPGPVASRDWYLENLRRCLREVPAGKLVMGLGSYGYDWTEGTRGAEVLSFQQVLELSRKSGARPELDAETSNPGFDYRDDQGRAHRVWFLDGVTAFNQMATVQREASGLGSGLPRGVALWRLGSEDPRIWEVLADYPDVDGTTASKLETLHYGFDLTYRGEGEVLKVTSLPETGRSDIDFDPASGMVTRAILAAYPSSYEITRWGRRSDKRVVLTFDDGPDAIYTPQVLEVLRSYQVPATFFMVGLSANTNSDLLRRVVDEGHEVGNHTFLHSLPSAISPERLRLEINVSQRLFESRLGRRSLLFRPPYGEDIEPLTPDEVGQLELTGALGYYTVGMNIEPDDWRGMSADQIVEAVVGQVTSGRGNVVLLHDGGGDRSATVAALPRIIEDLHARGYTFTSTAALLGLSRDDVMPPVGSEGIAAATARGTNGIAYRIIGGFGTIVRYTFLLAIALSLARLLWIVTLAVLEYTRRRRQFAADYLPRVSVLVPSHNEEKVVVRTVAALLRSYYPNYEVLVVDDGSTDGTVEAVVAAFGDEPRVRLLQKARGGKPEALNLGIRETDAEVLVTIDADTILTPEAVGNLVRHFVDPRVAAVAGNIKVGNRVNLLTYWQALEYIISQNLERRAVALLNCMFVVPGAIGAWRRSAVLEAGGFTGETLAEDADLTVKVLRLGYRVDYEQEAVAYTEAPQTASALVKQRFRWVFGSLQTAWKHRNTMFRPSYGALGWFAIPNVLILQIGLTLLSPFMDALMLSAVIGAGWEQIRNPNPASLDALQNLLLYYCVFQAIDGLASLIAFRLERGERRRLLLWLIPQRFVYRQLLSYITLRSVFRAIEGRFVGWGKTERKATVTR